MTEQLLSGAIAGLLGIFFKFIFDLGLKKLSISSDLKKKQGEIVIQNRLEMLNIIFMTFEKAWGLAIISRNSSNAQKIEEELNKISKMEMARDLYFSDDENKKIDEIIEEIRLCTGAGYIEFGNYKRLIKEFKKCLGVN